MITGSMIVDAAQQSKPHLCKIVRRFDVEELIQAATVRAFEKRHQYRAENGATLRTWFTTIALRMFFYEVRKAKNRTFIPPDVLDRIRDPRPGPLERVLATERKMQLIDAVMDLRPEYREAALHFATRTMTGDTLRKSRFFKAKQELKSTLEEI